MSLSENRKYMSRQEMERLAKDVLPKEPGFTSSEFYKHCEKLNIKKSTAASMLFKMKNCGMIEDVGKSNKTNSRLYMIKDNWLDYIKRTEK